MNVLLLFFALPVATIILAIVLERILKCPWLVGATFFAIYLIVTFAVFDASFLVFAILYAILALVTAILARILWNICERNRCNRRCTCKCNCNCICRCNFCQRQNDTTTVNAVATQSQQPVFVQNCDNGIGQNGSNANVNVSPAPTVILTNAPVETGRNQCCCNGRRRN